jgi:hypothetical protein
VAGEIFSTHQLIRKATFEFETVTMDGRTEAPVVFSLVRPPFEIPFDTRSQEQWRGKRVRCYIRCKYAFGLGLPADGLFLVHEMAPSTAAEDDIRQHVIRRQDRDQSTESRFRAQQQQLAHLTSMQRDTG